ncbi:MAG: hypothetical protein FWH19_03330 [Treponema sp.]|nr:hypothetical protein [Treponema sp.]
MKKVLIVLLAFAVAGGVFAQEMNWSGEVNVGVFIEFGDDFDDALVKVWDDDEAALSTKLLGEFDGGGWGANFGVNANVLGAGAAGVGALGDVRVFGVEIYDAHGWVDLLGGMLTARAGLIDPAVWDVRGWIDDNVSSGAGVRLEIKPIDGLNVGAFLSMPDSTLGIGSHVLPTTVANFLQETALGFAFDAGAFDLSAALKLYSEISSETVGDMDGKLIAGFGMDLGIAELYIGAALANLLDDEDLLVRLGLNLDFDLGGALGAKLEAGMEMQDGLSLVEATPGVFFGLSDLLTVGADITLTMLDNDGLGLATISPLLYLKCAAAGASITAGYGFDMFTADFGDKLNHVIKIVCNFAY